MSKDFSDAMNNFYKKFPQIPIGEVLRRVTGRRGEKVLTSYLQDWTQRDNPPTLEEFILLSNELSKVWGR